MKKYIGNIAAAAALMMTVASCGWGSTASQEGASADAEKDMQSSFVNSELVAKQDGAIKAPGMKAASGWLELPASTSGKNYISGNFGKGKNRNYSYLYDQSVYACLWEAYPLTASHIKGNPQSEWGFNPDFDLKKQVNVTVRSYGSNYGHSEYSRGHQVPSGDRRSNAKQNTETYYVTNQTPQLQEKFNATIWNQLEKDVRYIAGKTDTVYVVTGAAYQKKGRNEEVKTLKAVKSNMVPQTVSVPNYYWKVLLKVKRNGNKITDACAIGVWLPHKEYDTEDYSGCVVPVSTIEQYTGFDFFVNLSDDLEKVAESNTSWTAFKKF